MPTLFRLLFSLGVTAGTIAGSLYVLGEYFQPEPKEISKSLRNVVAKPIEVPLPGNADAETDPSVSGSVDGDTDAADAGGGAD